jgi:hypothetical protein
MPRRMPHCGEDLDFGSMAEPFWVQYPQFTTYDSGDLGCS